MRLLTGFNRFLKKFHWQVLSVKRVSINRSLRWRDFIVYIRIPSSIAKIAIDEYEFMHL